MTEETVSPEMARIDKHEAVCSERYASINARMRRVEGILIAGTGGLIVGGGAVIMLLITLLGKVNG